MITTDLLIFPTPQMLDTPPEIKIILLEQITFFYSVMTHGKLIIIITVYINSIISVVYVLIH